MGEGLKVINGYDILTNKSEDGDGIDLQIVFKHNGKDYIKSIVYKNLSAKKIDRVKDKLFDNVTYNLNCEEICQVISYITIMYMIDDIIEGED